MKTYKLVSIGKINAFAILILGIIHDIATYTPLIKGGLKCLSPDSQNAMIYMSLICGAAFILSGILMIMLLKKIEQYSFLISTTLFIGIFLALSGVLSVLYMFKNPFAWIALFLGMTMLVIVIRLKMLLNKRPL